MVDPPQVRLGVAGWPVGHSRSPAMHNAALAAAGLKEWRYELLPIPPQSFAATVAALPELGFRGINVTIPHKEAALALANRASARAQAIGAANTLLFETDGSIVADNTDAPGLLAALTERGLELPRSRVLVLGAGGTARAAVWALGNAGTDQVRVLARTPERAATLCAELGGSVAEAIEPANLLINCTPVGLSADKGVSASEPTPIPLAQVNRYETVVDFVYRNNGTPLVRAARRAGVPVIDGLELLVRQGALAFQQFTGREPDLEAMGAAAGAGA